MSGYCNDPTVTEAACLPDVDGPWFKTGDKGYLNSDNGQLVLHARFTETHQDWDTDNTPGGGRRGANETCFDQESRHNVSGGSEK